MSDMEKRPSDPASESAPTAEPKMDRRTFLLSLSGGAFVVAAGSLLAGCGGGANSGGSNINSGGNGGVQPINFQTVTLSGGQTGVLDVIFPTNTTASGSLTINPFLLQGARKHVGTAFTTLPSGTYTFTGTLSQKSTAGFTVTGSASYTPDGFSTSPASGPLPFTLVVVSPTLTQSGSFTGTYNGQSFSGTIPPTSGSSSSSTSSASSSSTSSASSSSTSSASSSSSAVGTGFMATVFGNIQSANGNGPQTFQIGPSTASAGSAALAGTPGTFSITSSNQAGLPSSNLSFSLFGTPGTPINSTTVPYSGTYVIYQTDPNSPVSSGTFSATATFTNPPGLDAVFNATFNATSGDTTYSPAMMSNAQFNSTAAGQGQTLSGTLVYSGA